MAMLPVLSMFAASPGQRSGSELADSLMFMVAACALLLLVIAVVYRDIRKAALATSLALAAWWLQPGESSWGTVLAPVVYLVVLTWGVWLYRRTAPLARLTGFANWVAIGLVLPPLITLAMAKPQASAITSRPIIAHRVVAKPDIYYLIFDRYGDDQTAATYGLQNDISAYLTSRGFYVARASRSNYMKTALSLCSSLNAEYLEDVVRGKENTDEWGPVFQHLRRHRVGAFLRAQGYSYTHLGSWFYPTRESPEATLNVNYYTRVPRAVLRMFDSPLLSPVQRAAGPWLDERRQNWIRIRRQVDDVLEQVRTPGPKFVLLHVLVPHPPYVFDRDGSYVTKAQERRRSYAQNYTNQVVAANAMIRRLVDGILRDSASPPVIIIQGDEGPYPPGTGREEFDWRTASTEQLLAKTGILNAYYLPGIRQGVFYPTISPVNSFRVVFNEYFGTDLPVLPDRMYRHVSDHRPFAFDDITQQVVTMARSGGAQR
jgi:hypothetical protein